MTTLIREVQKKVFLKMRHIVSLHEDEYTYTLFIQKYSTGINRTMHGAKIIMNYAYIALI